MSDTQKSGNKQDAKSATSKGRREEPRRRQRTFETVGADLGQSSALLDSQQERGSFLGNELSSIISRQPSDIMRPPANAFSGSGRTKAKQPANSGGSAAGNGPAPALSSRIQAALAIGPEAELMGAKAAALQEPQPRTSPSYSRPFQKQQEVGNTVAQREIVPGKLNVVGEKHTESKEGEKEYAEKVIKGDYWLENEFKIGPDPAWYDRLIGHDPRVAADPLILRIIQHLEYMLEKHGQYPPENEKAKKPYESFSYFAEQYRRNLNAFKQNTEGYDMSKELANYLKELKGYQFEIMPWPNAKGLIIETKTELIKLTNEQKKYSDISDDNNVSAVRSEEMHKSAEQEGEKGKKGIWKIGQAHVDDIHNNDWEPQSYELTSKTPFLNQVQVFARYRDKHGLEKGTDQYMADKNLDSQGENKGVGEMLRALQAINEWDQSGKVSDWGSKQIKWETKAPSVSPRTEKDKEEEDGS